MNMLFWNGTATVCSPDCTVEAWLQLQGFRGIGAGQGWVIALNEQVLPYSLWASTRLQSGDRLDLFTAIAGG